VAEICLIAEFDTLKCCNFNKRTKTDIGNEVLFPCSDTDLSKAWGGKGCLCDIPHRNKR